MHAEAMEPFGLALVAFFEGDTGAELIIRRDDGHETPLPAGYFFRDQSAFTPLENTAIERCRGHVLDAGAGTGLHTLVLQKNGLSVTAIDLSPHAVTVMARRGVADVCCANVFDYEGGPFDTVLMLGHGIGMVETVAGLDRFLIHAQRLVSEDGAMLVDSLDVRCTDEPVNLAYHEANRQAGRYIGETRIQTEFGSTRSPWFGWLHVDPETLTVHAEKTGWICEVLVQDENGTYLAKLTRAAGAPPATPP